MLKNTIKQQVIIIISSGLLACAGSETARDEAADASGPQDTDCISGGTVRDYRVLNDSNLLVTGAGRRKYHIVLSRRAYGLRSSWSIGFDSRTGMICAGFSDVVIADGSFRDNIRIARIRRLGPDDEEEILIRFGKIEPKTEQAPAPETVEGAEVEELD